MAYSEENIKKLNKKYADVPYIHRQLILKVSDFQSRITNEKAREYLMQGVGRRLNIFTKSLQNIFKIFPVDKTDLLSKDDLTDLYINLHAFIVNVSGILDNLAWVFVFENDLIGNKRDGKIDKHEVGLFKKKTQAYLKPKFRAYIKSDITQGWHKEYLKNFRDALVHRIPVYVPPAALTKEEQEEYNEIGKQLWIWNYDSPDVFSKQAKMIEKLNQLGQACTFYSHSLDEEGRHYSLHGQILADFITIEDIINKFFDDF